MKLFSITVILITLGLFYTLAQEEQKKWKSQEVKTFESHKKTSHELQQNFDNTAHLMIEDDFSMQVTGKEHRYLHTGITYYESQETMSENQCVADSTREEPSILTGS